MAKSSTSIYGFAFARSLTGVDLPVSLDFIIDDSVTVAIGDPVRVDAAGYIKRSTAGVAILGICIGLVDQNGVNVFSPRASGTTGATLTPDDTVATSSTNTSDATRKLKAQVVVSPGGEILWKNTASAALAQTNLCQFFDVGSTVGQIDVSTASDTSGQFQLLALDPDTTTIGLFRVAEGELAWNVNSYNSSAIIAS